MTPSANHRADNRFPSAPPQRESSGIHSDETGPDAAPLVVLIHGSLDRSAGMARVARHLHDRHRVLRYDRRGYGKSWPHTGGFDVASQVADLEELLAGRSAVLFGHSYGGNVALAAAERLGHQVRGVATYETPLSWLDWWPVSTPGAASISSGTAEAAERFLVRLVGQETWDALPERTKEQRRREGVALVGELVSLREGAPWNAGRISCPVRCAHGSLASEHHVRGARWLHDHLKCATLVTIEGAGHGAPNSHADSVVADLILPLVGGG